MAVTLLSRLIDKFPKLKTTSGLTKWSDGTSNTRPGRKAQVDEELWLKQKILACE